MPSTGNLRLSRKIVGLFQAHLMGMKESLKKVVPKHNHHPEHKGCWCSRRWCQLMELHKMRMELAEFALELCSQINISFR